MKFGDVLAVGAAIITSLGGASAIIWAVSSHLTKMITKQLEVKYEHILEKRLESHKQELQKELEQYKTKLEHGQYVTKTKFDKEFEIYGQLSKAFGQVKNDLSVLSYKKILNNFASQEDQQRYLEKSYKDLILSINNAKNVLFENTAFIPEKRFEAYEEVYYLAIEHYRIITVKYNDYMKGNHNIDSLWNDDDENRYIEILSRLKATNKELRSYLSTLSVLE